MKLLRPGTSVDAGASATDGSRGRQLLWLRAFHVAGLQAGGTDNGAPGLRLYGDNYYGAFVLDPEGNNVVAVCPTG